MRDFEQEMRDAMNECATAGALKDNPWIVECEADAIRIMREAVAAERERVKNALHRDCEQMFGLTEDETMEQLPRVRFLLCPTQDSDVEE